MNEKGEEDILITTGIHPTVFLDNLPWNLYKPPR